MLVTGQSTGLDGDQLKLALYIQLHDCGYILNVRVPPVSVRKKFTRAFVDFTSTAAVDRAVNMSGRCMAGAIVTIERI